MLRRADALLISATALTLGYLFLRRRRRVAAASLPHAQVDARGFLVAQAAAAPEKVARMRSPIEPKPARPRQAAISYGRPLSRCRRCAVSGRRRSRCHPSALTARRDAGGAPLGPALWKRQGARRHAVPPGLCLRRGRVGGSSASRATRHVAVWLALTPTGPRSGCLRFAPAGTSCSPTDLPRADAPSGFETHMVGPRRSGPRRRQRTCLSRGWR